MIGRICLPFPPPQYRSNEMAAFVIDLELFHALSF
jgi:hypothetical protein